MVRMMLYDVIQTDAFGTFCHRCHSSRISYDVVCVCVPLEHFITDVTGLSLGQEKG